MGKPHFLLCNDDGVHAPGLRKLAQVCQQFGEVTIVAPHVERSASSHAITIAHPLRIERLEERVFGVEGTPADCILLALHQILHTKPDLIISGINRGANLGSDTIYSGTVGAAMEGVMNGVPSLAISAASVSRAHVFSYESSAYVVERVLQNQEALILTPPCFANINIPDIPVEEIKGFCTAQLGNYNHQGAFVESQDPRGRPYFWHGAVDIRRDSNPQSDCQKVAEGYVTLSALRASYYARQATEHMAAKLETLDAFI